MNIAGQMVIDSMGNITKTNHMDPEFIEQPRETAILVNLQMEDFRVQYYKYIFNYFEGSEFETGNILKVLVVDNLSQI